MISNEWVMKRKVHKGKNGKLIEFSRHVEIQAILLKLLFRMVAIVKYIIVTQMCDDQENWQVHHLYP